MGNNNIKYDIAEGVEDERDVDAEVVKGFIRSLKPMSRGKSLKIRDYQYEAVDQPCRTKCKPNVTITGHVDVPKGNETQVQESCFVC